MTLKDAIEQRKCRRGPAHGTTKDGAYWCACTPIPIRCFGGDGIGSNAPDRTSYLELRHYRDGSTRAVLNLVERHQDAWKTQDEWLHVPALLTCETIEDVIVRLKASRYPNHDCAVYGDSYEEELTRALSALGLSVAAPAPDEEPTHS